MKHILQLALGAVLATPAIADTSPGWQRYRNPESGLTVDIPARHLRSRRRPRRERPRSQVRHLGWPRQPHRPDRGKPARRYAGGVSRRERSAARHRLSPRDENLLRRFQLPRRQDLVQPLQLCRPRCALRADQLSRARKGPLGWHRHPPQPRAAERQLALLVPPGCANDTASRPVRDSFRKRGAAPPVTTTPRREARS
jgi:hypothetical protein